MQILEEIKNTLNVISIVPKDSIDYILEKIDTRKDKKDCIFHIQEQIEYEIDDGLELLRSDVFKTDNYEIILTKKSVERYFRTDIDTLFTNLELLIKLENEISNCVNTLDFINTLWINSERKMTNEIISECNALRKRLRKICINGGIKSC